MDKSDKLVADNNGISEWFEDWFDKEAAYQVQEATDGHGGESRLWGLLQTTGVEQLIDYTKVPICSELVLAEWNSEKGAYEYGAHNSLSRLISE